MPAMNKSIKLFRESAISYITKLNDKYDAINLSEGVPGLEPPEEMLKALTKSAASGPHQYAPSSGYDSIKKIIADKAGMTYSREVNPEKEIVVTCGATEGLICTLLAMLNPGDKVMVFSPFYESYGPDILLSGGEPVFIKFDPFTYEFDMEEIRDGFKNGARAIIICNPNNPGGKVFTREELKEIGNLAKKYDAFIIADEVYEHIVFQPSKFVSVASIEGLYDNTVVCNSISKTFSSSGWRVGYVTGPERIIENVKKVHDYVTSGAPSILQKTAECGFELDESYYAQLNGFYMSRRDYFAKKLDEAGIKHNNPQGTFFMLIDISQYLKLDAFKEYSDMDFCKWMIENIGVTAVPGSGFLLENTSNFIRVHFAKDFDVLNEAAKRLAKLNSLT